MVWKGDSWENVVKRAANRVRPRVPAPKPKPRESPQELTARSHHWGGIPDMALNVRDDRLILGFGVHSREILFTELYRIEPVDPWPSLALGWVDGDVAYRAVITRSQQPSQEYLENVEAAVSACEKLVPDVTARGWLTIPVHPWEPVLRMPTEGDSVPTLHGYRTAPAAPDPILATTTYSPPPTGLKKLFLKFLGDRDLPRVVLPRQVVLTKGFVYALTPLGDALRLPRELLRTKRKGSLEDTIYVFGRNTELRLPNRDDCRVRPLLDAQVPSSSE